MRAPSDTMVLVVDDEPSMRELLAAEFKKRKFNTKSATSGKEGLACLKEGGIDVVVSDIRMPDGSGLELLEWCKGTWPEIPVILMTGYSGVILEETLDMGCARVFVKPFDRAALAACITQATSPLLEAWSAKPELAPTLTVKERFRDLASALGSGNLAIGTRGFSLKMTEIPVPRPGDIVGFELSFDKDAPGTLKGIGHVRWSRAETGGKSAAIGIEIAALDPDWLGPWCEYFGQTKTLKFIPKL